MSVKTERQHKGEFLLSQGPGDISFESGTLLSGEVLKDGSVVALSGGKLVASTGNAGAETQVGISFGDYDASDGDLKGVVYVARLATVKKELVYIDATNPHVANDADTIAELAQNFIIMR